MTSPSSKSEVCKTCNGTGLREFGDKGAPCFSCGGSKVEFQPPVSAPEKCPKCGTTNGIHNYSIPHWADSAQPTPGEGPKTVIGEITRQTIDFWREMNPDIPCMSLFQEDLFPEYQGTTTSIQGLVDERNDWRLKAQGQASSAKEIEAFKKYADQLNDSLFAAIDSHKKLEAERDQLKARLKELEKL